MAAFFGRRHSVAGSPAEDDGLSRRFIRRRASAPNLRGKDSQHEQESRFQGIRDFFRRRTKREIKCGTPDATGSSSPSESSPQFESPQQEGRVHSGSAHTEACELSSEYQLTNSDIEMIFSGAPYFLLEKGKQDQWYPHVIFPFDDHDPTIQALWDRRALPYSSYTLSTLHAHLPIPNDWMIEGDAPIQLDSRRQTGRPKRASFDLGTFEVPNMLSMNGKEPGSVGFHYFLESPVADSVRFTGPPEVNAEAEFLRLSSLPAMEAYDLMEHRSQPYALCADGTVHDRKRLLLDGPSAWKKIGVRDIDMRHLVARLQILKDLRDETLHGEVTKTILDMEGIPYLGSGLFTNILYPPPRFMTIAGEDRHSLQSQIKALTAALATPGAWFDFNLPEWRLRIGQIIWEVSPHDGDFVDVSTCDKPWAGPSLERKWFLVQMVLAAELLLRLDAAVRVGLLRCSHDLQISEADIHDFERLRTAKVNWDMVAVRRLMDSFNFNYSPIQPEPSQSARSESSESSKKPHHFSFKNHRESASGKVLESAWTCNLIPGHVNRQLKGLLLFAENIGWPRIAELKEQFQLICQNGNSQRVNDAYNQPTQSISSTGHSKTCKNTMYSRSLSSRPLSLRYTKDPDTSGLSGWITRTWLAGLVLPGESISNILMATILENDVDAMMMLGPAANLYGGFSYHGRSWWSQECIVGRVLSSLDTNMCMGWLGSGLLPKDCRGLEPLDNTWFEVNVMDPPSCPGGPRIKQGKKISVKSTPLGVGDLTSGAFSLPVDAGDCGSKTKIDFQSLVFDVKGSSQQPKINEKHPLVARQATMVFSLGSSRRKSPGTVSFPLLYNVRFISSHECRPPGGLVLYRAPGNATKRGSSSASSSPIRRRHLPRLPGHPLHRSYTYKVISLDVLPKMPEPDSRSATGSDRALMWQEIMVLDARGGPEQEAFARAWCASVGYHAIVGRIGRTCLACCIREARAVKIRVVIRVGDGTMNGSLSNVNTRPSISS